jgi:glycosyltransferase involved in cell wall biosynthesis
VATPETSVLVPPGDAPALAEALIGLLEDEERRVALGAAGRRLAEAEYGWTRIGSRMVEIYGGLIGAPVADRAAA